MTTRGVRMMTRCPKGILQLFTERLLLWRTSAMRWCSGEKELAPPLCPCHVCLHTSKALEKFLHSPWRWHLHLKTNCHPRQELQYHAAAQPLCPCFTKHHIFLPQNSIYWTETKCLFWHISFSSPALRKGLCSLGERANSQAHKCNHMMIISPMN